MRKRLSQSKRERAEFLAYALADFRRFCGLLQIPLKSGERIRLKLSPIQRAYDAARTPRDIVLKPRQVFMTTLECARDLWIFLTRRGARVVVVCQSQTDHGAMKDISYKFRVFIDSLRAAGLELNFGTESMSEWSLPDRDSTLRIIQAGASIVSAGKKGRGGTLTRLHVTEEAFFEYAQETFNSLNESVAGPETGSEIVIESTANGAAGFYYEQWQQAVSGASGYKAHFFRWWDHPEYQLPLGPGETIEAETDIERSLIAQGVTRAQLKWFRRKVADKGGNLALTLQEYPSDPDTCFRVSGRSFFNADTTAKLLRAATVPPIEQRIINRSGAEGWVRIWARPENGVRYLVVADTAEGVGEIVDGKAEGGDAAAAHVYEYETARHMATLWGQLKPHELAAEIAKLGTEYNGCYVVVERANHGHACLRALHAEQKYPRIWKDRDDKPGWLNHEVTRGPALDALEQAHRDGLWKSHCTQTLGEVRTFIVNRRGRPEASPGAHDDLVLCAAIGWNVLGRPVAKVGMSTKPIGIL